MVIGFSYIYDKFHNPSRYKKNLKAFYIVHPTIWTKMMTWWFTTFMAPAIKQKVHNLPGVEYLYSVMEPDQLEIPAYITEYDMTVSISLLLCMVQVIMVATYGCWESSPFNGIRTCIVQHAVPGRVDTLQRCTLWFEPLLHSHSTVMCIECSQWMRFNIVHIFQERTLAT